MKTPEQHGASAVEVLSTDVIERAAADYFARSAETKDFSALWDVCAPYVRSYLLKYKYADAQNIEDIEQEIVIQLLHKAHMFSGDSTFCTWLVAVARNAAISFERRVATRKMNTELLPNMDDGFELIDPHALPADENITRQETTDRVQRALSTFTGLQQRLLRSFHFEEKTYAEIAELESIPIGTVRSRLHRMRGLLREEIQKLKL